MGKENWIKWLQARIPILRKYHNIFLLNQAFDGYLERNSQTTGKDITINDIDLPNIIDNEGYHCDYELTNFKYNGYGRYEMTMKNLSRSDKSVTEKK